METLLRAVGVLGKDQVHVRTLTGKPKLEEHPWISPSNLNSRSSSNLVSEL